MVTLQTLDLHIQLGHGGAPCPLPSTGPGKFCVFDTSSVHYISVDFCECQMNGFIHQRTQLLHACWFPASFNWPKTVFTFDCLDTFHEFTLQGKTSLYDFYHTILHKTDNLELNKTVVSASQASKQLCAKYFLTIPISRVPPCVSHLVKPFNAEACRPWAGFSRCPCYWPRRIGHQMSCLSSSRLESAEGMGVG